MKVRRITMPGLLAGFLGGLCGGLILAPFSADAQGYMDFIGKNIFLYTAEGGHRIQLATYDAGREKGQPLIGLYDNKDKLRLLVRLAGGNESPVLVFKDNMGKDRMVLGMALNDAREDPFLVTFDMYGNKRMIFGEYGGTH